MRCRRICELSGDSEDEAVVEELYGLSGDEEYDVFESSEEELMDMNQGRPLVRWYTHHCLSKLYDDFRF